MPNAELDDAYNNFKFIEGAEHYPEKWQSAAAAFRDVQRSAGLARLDFSYGNHSREKLDLFYPGGSPRGLVVFVHGGFWKSRSKLDWSHLARGSLERGYAVTIPGYVLCPEARISNITEQIRAAVECAAGQVPGPILLTGHSAGGHLVTRLCCPDAAPQPSTLSRIKRVVAISGLFDLRPLLDASMNSELCMDPAEADRESPALVADPHGIPCIAWVGGLERPAFIEQSRRISKKWRRMILHVEPGRHHFDVIEDLESRDSALMAALAEGNL